VLVKEMQSLCLDVRLGKDGGQLLPPAPAEEVSVAAAAAVADDEE